MPYCSIYRYCKCLKPAFDAKPAQDRDFSCARFHIVLGNGLLSYNFVITVSIDTTLLDEFQPRVCLTDFKDYMNTFCLLLFHDSFLKTNSKPTNVPEQRMNCTSNFARLLLKSSIIQWLHIKRYAGHRAKHRLRSMSAPIDIFDKRYWLQAQTAITSVLL